MAGVFNNYPYGYSTTPINGSYTINPSLPTMNQANTPKHQTIFDYVLGEQAAKSYLLAPGNSAILMDSEQSIFYIKTVDPSGIPSPLRKFRYVEEVDQPQSEEVKTPTTDYISRSEFENFKDEMQNLIRNRKWDSNTKKMTNKEGQ